MGATSSAQAANYACAAISLAIVLLRAGLTMYHRKKLDLSFQLVLFSILAILSRIVVNHFYLSFGTASDVLSGKLTDYDPFYVRAGSILVIVARLILAIILWLQMSILLLFYQNLLSGINVVVHLIRATWIMLGLTFIGTILATVLECRPIELYWQISPDPGQCVRAYAQLVLQGASNGVVDIMLLVISFPILSLQKRTLGEHLRLYTLFVLGTFCIVITILRVALIFNNGSSQETRSLWASVQIVVSTFVANAPNVYGMLRIARRKSSSDRGGATMDATEIPRRRTSATMSPGVEPWMKMSDLEFAMVSPQYASAALDLDVDPSPYDYPRGYRPARMASPKSLNDDPTARHSYPSSSMSTTNVHEHRQSAST